MKTIIVATDFSPAALDAAAYAADMAVAVTADMLLLHVFAYPVSYTEIPLMVDTDSLKTDAEARLQRLKTKLIAETGNTLKIHIEVRMGQFFSELQFVCETIKPYTVVIGSQGTSAGERFLFGSHAAYAMKHLVWPLITVPLGAKFSSIKKIGLACDFNKVTRTIPIDEIKTLVKSFNAQLHVINTAKKETYDPGIFFESAMLEKLFKDLQPTYHFIENEDTDEGIMAFTEKNNIDLLVVIPKRHSLIDSLIHESHTKQLVLHSHVPVMALHLQ